MTQTVAKYTAATVVLSGEALRLVIECIDSEIEHTSDMIREMDDDTAEQRERIRVEMIRQDRLEAIRQDLAA